MPVDVEDGHISGDGPGMALDAAVIPADRGGSVDVGFMFARLYRRAARHRGMVASITVKAAPPGRDDFGPTAASVAVAVETGAAAVAGGITARKIDWIAYITGIVSTGVGSGDELYGQRTVADARRMSEPADFCGVVGMTFTAGIEAGIIHHVLRVTAIGWGSAMAGAAGGIGGVASPDGSDRFEMTVHVGTTGQYGAGSLLEKAGLVVTTA